MMRAAMLATLLVGIALQPAAAQSWHREELRLSQRPALGAGSERGGARSCAEYGPDCAVHAVDDQLAEPAGARSR